MVHLTGVFSLLRDLLVCGLWSVCVGATFCCFGLLVVVGCFVYLLGGFVWWVGGFWVVDWFNVYCCLFWCVIVGVCG